MSDDEDGVRDGRITAVAECLAGLLNTAGCAGVLVSREDCPGGPFVVEGQNGDEWVRVLLRWEGEPAVWRLSKTTRAPLPKVG